MGGRKWEQWEYEKMESMHNQGTLWEEIAIELGRNKDTTRKKLYGMGYQPNKKIISYAHNNININWAKDEMERTDKKYCNRDFVYYVMRGEKYDNRIDAVNLSTLPIENNGVNWNSVKDHAVTLYFDGKLYDLKITSNQNEKRQVGILLNGVEGVSHDSNIKKIKFSTYIPMQKTTYKYKYNIGDVVEFEESKFKILEQKQLKGGKVKNKTGYLIECLDCGYIHDKRQSSLDLKRGCACCTCRIVVKGINNANYLYPHIKQYLVNESDGDILTPYDVHKPIKTKCPNCNYVNDKSRMFMLCKEFKCTQCMSGSRGERVISNMLKNGGYDYKPQLTIESYFYDFYIPSLNMLLEIDGEQHRQEVKHFQVSLKEQQKIDKKKEELAISLGYKFKRIAVDTYESIESIVEKMDFIEFDKDNLYDYLLDNQLMDFVELYNNGVPMNQIQIVLKKHKARITYLANLASTLGLIEYNKEDSKYRHSIKKVRCVQTGELFDSITEAKNEYNAHNIGRVCSGQSSYSGTLPDGTPLTWEYVTVEAEVS